MLGKKGALTEEDWSKKEGRRGGREGGSTYTGEIDRQILSEKRWVGFAGWVKLA